MFVHMWASSIPIIPTPVATPDQIHLEVFSIKLKDRNGVFVQSTSFYLASVIIDIMDIYVED